MHVMSMLHVCVDLSFDQSGKLMEICLLSSCTFLTGVPCGKKLPLDPASSMASCLVICIIDVDYYVSICLLGQLLVLIFLSSLLSVVASSANLLVVLCVMGYNDLPVVSYRLFLCILPHIGIVS